MKEKDENEITEGRKVDLRNVFVDEKTDAGIDEYQARQKRIGQKVKKGEAAVKLIQKGLNAEGIEA